MVQVSSSKRPSASERVLPPPLPPLAPASSADLIDETFEDIRQLTADIDRVISKKAPIWLVHPQMPTRAVSSAGEKSLLGTDASDEGAGFNWESAGKPHSRRSGRSNKATSEPAEQVADWIARSRQQRRFDRLKAAGSWALALGIAVSIAVTAVVVFHGELPGPEQFAGAVKALGL